MKKTMICFLMLLCWAAKAQTFEGVIRYSMKMEITDPKLKAQIDAAQNRKVSPEEQEKIKKMQEKMNDPQFKAMMDANPQMKAQMEAALKMSQGQSADMSSMMPTGSSIAIKDGNTLMKTEGGVMPMETLYLKDKDQSYILHRDSKTYNLLPHGKATAATPAPDQKVKVTKTSETTKILGYTCTRYNVELTEHGKTINQVIWATTEIKNLDVKNFSKSKMSNGQSYFHDQIDGMPLRVQITMPQQGNMTMEVIELKQQSLPASDFTVPADFKETTGMFGR